MGRRKKEVEMVQKHIKLSREISDQVEIVAEKENLSFTEALEKLAKQGLNRKAAKYKGFQEVIMSHDFTCFECQERKKAGKLAMYDAETGATICMGCAIDSEMTTRDVAKLIILKLRLKRDIKSLKIEKQRNAQEYLKLEVDIENKELIKRIFAELKEGKEKAYRVLGISDTPEDFKLTAEGLLRWMDKKEKILDVILTKKEKEKWEKLKEEQRKKKRKKQLYAS